MTKMESPKLSINTGAIGTTSTTSNESQALTQALSVQVFSVEALNKQIKNSIETKFVQIWVRGEISNFKAHASGHFYFSLKDQNSQIRAVMFRGNNSRLKFKPYDGVEVIVRGKVTVYEPRGDYQISCDMMEPVGAGALQRAFEELKLKLKQEGLFESSRKKAIPEIPRHIAIVTSPTGAAIRDILNILNRRGKGLDVTIVPSLVQGEAAAAALRTAFVTATQLPNVDVIIIGRGGGSIEDMWCFNDEALARLISQSAIPVISAVGHEIDFTIADFVADLRAPTPSAAAELVVKSADELLNKINGFQRILRMSLSGRLTQVRTLLHNLGKRLIDPKQKLQDLMQKNDDLYNRMSRAMERILERKKIYLTSRMDLLDSLSPLKVVDRGYSLVTKNGQLIKSNEQLIKDDLIDVKFAKGTVQAKVL
jgi:exodeoxyribonuclease VII large subunit